MLRDKAPWSIIVARVALVISVGLMIITAVQIARSIRWGETAGVVVAQVAILTLSFLIALALALWPLWLMRRGSRLAVPVATFYAVLRIVPTFLSFDAVSLAVSLLSVAPAVLLWLPDSRRYLHAVRAERARVRTPRRRIAFD
ncbi:hypothetical protein VD659_14510 [Herbiconiux sp. 11R-BC]|uniref:hypothetical protein n=1 Tax=Herbiconiux sp. 11R-BC TaxID=3111637 RepID=UPI003C107E8B